MSPPNTNNTFREPKPGETCRWYASAMVPECAKPAKTVMLIKGEVVNTELPLCVHHEADVKRRYSAIRAAKRAGRTGANRRAG